PGRHLPLPLRLPVRYPQRTRVRAADACLQPVDAAASKKQKNKRTNHPQPMTLLRTHLHEAAQRLLAAHCADILDEARLEAELLYGHAAGIDRARVLAAGADEPSLAILADFEALLTRRLAHEPLAYILGRRECFG